MPKVNTFEDYSKWAYSSAMAAVEHLGGDKYLSSIETTELVNYLCNLYCLPAIHLLNEGKARIIPDETSSKYSDAGSARLTIRFDVEPSTRIEKSLGLRQASTPPFLENDSVGYYVKESLSPDRARATIDDLAELVRSEVTRRNTIIDEMNSAIRTRITETVGTRKSKLDEQDEALSRLAQVIPLEINPNPPTPIVPLSKKKEIVVNPPPKPGTFQSRIKPETLDAIIDVLIRGGRTFETTPQTFLKLDEEDLRNLLIAFLNGNFTLKAVGEAFNKKGKTDISLVFSGNNLFIAECKFWDGQKKYQEAIQQLFGYLTWRETIGVLISFVKDRDFTSIIEKAKTATSEHASFVRSSLITKHDSYFLSTHIFPEDKDKTIRVHHILFTIPAPIR